MKIKIKNNIPKRKRMNGKARLDSARQWVEKFSGKNIVKGYAKWYAVDLLCAIKELRMLGIKVDAEYEKQVRRSLDAKNRKKKQQNETKEVIADFADSDSEFAFIAGYTYNEAPYGIRHDENMQ